MPSSDISSDGRCGKEIKQSIVMSGVNPQGCRYSAITPQRDGIAARFSVWTTVTCRNGDESAYSADLLRGGADRSRTPGDSPRGIADGSHDEKTVWEADFAPSWLEKHLHRNGTRIVKFYLTCRRRAAKALSSAYR
jgi:hypothetical protein